MPLEAVRDIITRVRSEGDRALVELTRCFDGVEIEKLRVDPATIKSAPGQIPPELLESLTAAAEQVAAYQQQRAAAMGIGREDRFRQGGVNVVTRRAPVRRAGLYVPGGRARYPSTVLMTVLPARAAGVREVCVCIPPGPGGDPPLATLAAAAVVGIDEVYRVGGAQAIAALAYGTESVGAVDVIAGPGNIYVSLAEREVSSVVGVPGAFAGPSEVVVVADDASPAELVATDLAVQAEHGPDGLAWLVTWSVELAEDVAAELRRIVSESPRRSELEVTLGKGGYVALVDGPEEAAEVVDLIAPEHLEIMTGDPGSFAGTISNAGCIFLGTAAPASIGDYLAGPSHVLPTNGTARFAGALSPMDFTRERSEVEVEPDFYDFRAEVVASIAGAEGLAVHAESVRARQRSSKASEHAESLRARRCSSKASET